MQDEAAHPPAAVDDVALSLLELLLLGVVVQHQGEHLLVGQLVLHTLSQQGKVGLDEGAEDLHHVAGLLLADEEGGGRVDWGLLAGDGAAGVPLVPGEVLLDELETDEILHNHHC